MIELGNLEIRNMEMKDKEKVLELFNLINHADNLEMSITAEIVEYFLSKPEYKRGIFIVYHNEDLIGLGTCITTGTSDTEGGIEISIHPDFRGMGVENELFKVLFNRSKEDKFERITTQADKDIKYLKDFYTEKEFKEFEYMWKMKLALEEKDEMLTQQDGIKFIEAKKDDLGRITDLMNDGFREGKEGKYKEEIFESRFADPDNYIYLLEKDGELIGTSNISLNKEFSIGYISNLAVYKKYRGQGYGKLLINLSIEKIRERGLDTASLHVVGTNDKALGLYKKTGFKEYNTTIRYEKYL